MKDKLRLAIAIALCTVAPALAFADDPLDCKNHYILDGPCVAIGPMVVTHTTPTGPAPGGAAIDATTGRVFVANSGTGRIGGTDSSVTVIKPDGTSTTLPMAAAPMRIAANDALRKVVVSNGGFGPLGATILDSDTLAHRFVDLGYMPSEAQFDPSRGVAYVAGRVPNSIGPQPPNEAFYKGSFSVIDLNAGTARTIAVTRDPIATLYVPSRERVYLAMHGAPGHVMRPATAAAPVSDCQ